MWADGIFPQELDFLPALVHHPDPQVRILCDFPLFVMLVGVELDQGIGKPGQANGEIPSSSAGISDRQGRRPRIPGSGLLSNFFLDDMTESAKY